MHIRQINSGTRLRSRGDGVVRRVVCIGIAAILVGSLSSACSKQPPQSKDWSKFDASVRVNSQSSRSKDHRHVHSADRIESHQDSRGDQSGNTDIGGMSGRYPVGANGTLERPAGWIAPKEPEFPKVAQGTGITAAREFIKYYLQVLEYATNTGDVARLSNISESGCDECALLIAGIKNIYDSGGWINDSKIVPGSIHGPEHSFDGTLIATVTYTNFVPSAYIDGELVERKNPKSVSREIILREKNGRYYMQEFSGISFTHNR